jgi:hypothetical protein
LIVHSAKYCQCSELSEITMGIAARIGEAIIYLRQPECNINADLAETVARIGGVRQWRTGAAL